MWWIPLAMGAASYLSKRSENKALAKNQKRLESGELMSNALKSVYGPWLGDPRVQGIYDNMGRMQEMVGQPRTTPTSTGPGTGMMTPKDMKARLSQMMLTGQFGKRG
jgi:hypothetical protein